ncbi:unnamed protein product [Rotaria socialis]|uniref:Uncharacterized protein n=1 Tax=Rotaria socialis TaxID=392032 RepID=A0A818BR52_9BILA|nr:unnamed protein product [Rotaria socialis]
MVARRIHVNIVASLIMFMLLLSDIRVDVTADTTQMSGTRPTGTDTSMQAMTSVTTITVTMTTSTTTKPSNGNVQQELINMPLLFMVIIFLSLAVKDI